MELLTEEIEQRIPALYSTEEIETKDKIIVCKFFSIRGGWTWYVVEGERQKDGDYLFFGLVDGIEQEWGYFTLGELLCVKWHGVPGIERDLHFESVKVDDCSELSPQRNRSSLR